MASDNRREAKHTTEWKFRCTPDHREFLESLPWGEASARLREAVDAMQKADASKAKKRARDRKYRKSKAAA